MTLPVYGPDVLVYCTRSGLVLALEAAVARVEDRAMVAERLYKQGIDTRFHGNPCVGCRSATMTEAFCEYRPLRGPLFVPRPTTVPAVPMSRDT